MAKFWVLTLSLATFAVVAGQRKQFNFDSGPPPSGPFRPSGPGRGPPSPSFPYRFLSAMQTQAGRAKELFASASTNPQFRHELFGPPRGPTHFSAPPKTATFFLEPPTRDVSSFYGGRSPPPPSFGRSPAPLFKSSSLKNPISLQASAFNNQLPQEYVLSSSPGNRGRPSPTVQEIVAQAAQTQHDKVVQKEQRAHPSGSLTHSQIRVARPGGPPPQLQQGLGFNPYASQVIGGQNDYQQLIMTRGPDGNPVLLQVQSAGPVQYSGQPQGSIQYSGQQTGPVQYISQQEAGPVQHISQQQTGPQQYTGPQQIQLSEPQQPSFQFGSQQPIQYTSLIAEGRQPGQPIQYTSLAEGRKPGQLVQYIQSSGGQGQTPTILTPRPSSSPSVEEISLTNFPQKYSQQNPVGSQQFDASPFLSQGGFPGHTFPLDGPSTVYQQGQDGQQGQQLYFQSQGGQGFGNDQSAYILQSQGQDIQQLQQNQIEQPKRSQSSQSPQRAEDFQIQTAISESVPDQRQRSEQNVKPSSPGSSGGITQFLQQDALGAYSEITEQKSN